jgi:hypothetical protein
MRNVPAKPASPTVTVRVSGTLSQGHLSYLDQLVASAIDCGLWPLLDLTRLRELDRFALTYLIGGEGRGFGLVACPNFIREWMQHEKELRAAPPNQPASGIDIEAKHWTLLTGEPWQKAEPRSPSV